MRINTFLEIRARGLTQLFQICISNFHHFLYLNVELNRGYSQVFLCFRARQSRERATARMNDKILRISIQFRFVKKIYIHSRKIQVERKVIIVSKLRQNDFKTIITRTYIFRSVMIHFNVILTLS